MQMGFWYYVCVTFYLKTELLPEISFQVIFLGMCSDGYM